MRLLTFLDDGRPRLGALTGHDEVVDLTAAFPDREELRSMAALLAAGPEAIPQLAAVLSRVPAFALRPLAGLKLAPPVWPSKICAIGLNYADHAREGGRTPPERPTLFAKMPTTVIGPGDEIRWDPALSSCIDYEAELVVVIGAVTRRVPAARAYEYVLGYTCGNDVTARDIQQGDGQWVRGKSLDTFCPLGPWIVTRDEVPDPHTLAIRSEVDGELRQSSNTAELIHNVPKLIEFLSAAFTLLPGDVIMTGTPSGVGQWYKPSRYLNDGSVVTVTIDGIGSLTNPCRTENV